MGEAVVTSLVNDVVRRLTSTAFQELGLLWKVEDELSSLRDDFSRIQSDIDKAEQIHINDDVEESWIQKLKSASVMVENVLEEVSTEAMLRRLHTELGIKYSLRAFFSSNHNRLMFRFNIAHKVKSIRRKLGTIEAKRSELNMTSHSMTSADVGIGGVMPNRETSSLILSSIIYGRNEEMEMVVEKVCNKDIVRKHDIDRIRVYAIWGMGGLGKTTLAQLVYNHEKVNKHFEVKCWMYVSEKFHVKELMRGIIEIICDCKFIHSQLDALQVRLQKELQGKRFFIVLDDVWIEDEEKSEWDKLSNALSCGAEGSIVLVTTRNQTTSRMMAKVPEWQHELGCLSKEDSWSLFEKLAFAEDRAGGDRRELEPIGKEIVEKCKGLPLAVKTLGGLMWSKSSTSDWERVRDNEIWQLHVNNILPALKLSYDNLLQHFKRCFSYCCLFPKGSEMKKDVLIELWMSNGLIPRRGEEAELYVFGEEIFNCLVWRSFFQVVEEKYKMHDLMHDLARYVMRHNCLVIEPSKELVIPEVVLHFSSPFPDFVITDQDLNRLRLLKSIIIFDAYHYEGNISRILDFGYLRVLYLVRLRSTTLPESICKLKYLKYLNLSWSRIEGLPELIMYLQNLQVLLLEGCKKLRKLPESMRYLRNLQHLNIKHCDSLESLPEGLRYMRNLQHLNTTYFWYFPVGIKELTRLRTLSKFNLGKKLGAKIGELGDLNLLEGELEITGLAYVKGGLREAKEANLKCKRNLLVLRLKWNQHDGLKESTEEEKIAGDEGVLEGLEPNPSLKQLEIHEYEGKIISPSWMVNLKNLVNIKFRWSKNCERILALGKLPSLKVLKLIVMYSLKCLHDEDNTSTSGDNIMFPSLQELDIQTCGDLVSLPGNLPKLELLYLYKCEGLVSLPSNLPNLKKLHIMLCRRLCSLPDEIQSFKDLNELEIERCENLYRRYRKDIGVDWHKISHIPYIKIEPRW